MLLQLEGYDDNRTLLKVLLTKAKQPAPEYSLKEERIYKNDGFVGKKIFLRGI